MPSPGWPHARLSSWHCRGRAEGEALAESLGDPSPTGLAGAAPVASLPHHPATSLLRSGRHGGRGAGRGSAVPGLARPAVRADLAWRPVLLWEWPVLVWDSGCWGRCPGCRPSLRRPPCPASSALSVEVGDPGPPTRFLSVSEPTSSERERWRDSIEPGSDPGLGAHGRHPLLWALQNPEASVCGWDLLLLGLPDTPALLRGDGKERAARPAFFSLFLKRPTGRSVQREATVWRQGSNLGPPARRGSATPRTPLGWRPGGAARGPVATATLPWV